MINPFGSVAAVSAVAAAVGVLTGAVQKIEFFETIFVLYIDKDLWNSIRHPILFSNYIGSLYEFY
jgi:hypothetical protein